MRSSTSGSTAVRQPTIVPASSSCDSGISRPATGSVSGAGVYVSRVSVNTRSSSAW